MARVDSAIKGKPYSEKQHWSSWNSKAIDDGSDWGGLEIRDIYEVAFAGAAPDAVYLVNVKYGHDNEKTHEVLLLVQNKTVITLDGTTTAHQFQKWDDYDSVADQVNVFAKNHGLTFAKGSLKKDKELRLYKGEIKSTAQIQRTRLAGMKERGKIGLEGTNELPFEDDFKLVRMNPNEQALWARKGANIESVAGEAWKLVNASAALENEIPIAVILVKDNNVQALYTEVATYGREEGIFKINKKKIDRTALRYLRAAMNVFGWGVKNVAQLVIAPESKQHKVLQSIMARPDNKELPRYIKRYARTTNVTLEHLRTLGLIRSAQGQGRFRSPYLTLTTSGRMVYNQLESGQSVNTTGLLGEEKIKTGWKRPEPKKAPKRPTKGQRGTITGRTKPGTKAAQALEKFEEFVIDKERIPTRSEFIEILIDEPFNMSKTGAQTYYYTTKAKYMKRREQTNESYVNELLKAAWLRTDRKPFSALRSLIAG